MLQVNPETGHIVPLDENKWVHSQLICFDFERFQDKDGSIMLQVNMIGEDEPVMLFRGTLEEVDNRMEYIYNYLGLKHVEEAFQLFVAGYDDGKGDDNVRI